MSRNSRFNQWECVFWLECCVSKQTKRFKMADKQSREYFPMPWMRTFRRYKFISNWIKYCPNYKIKGKFVFAFHVRQFCPDNDYPRTEGSTTERNASHVWRAAVIILWKETVQSVSIFTLHFSKHRNDRYENWGFPLIWGLSGRNRQHARVLICQQRSIVDVRNVIRFG